MGDDFSDEDEDLETLLERDNRRDEQSDGPHAVGEESGEENADSGQNRNEDANTAGDDDGSRKPVTPKRKIVRNPQPKLNADRICGKQGISLLTKLFDDAKFKGKGYEKEDLNKLMAGLEHWAHRLFPQLPFDTILDRIERLGNKKPVQVYVKKMRMDMLTEESDRPVVDSDDDEERNNVSETQSDARNTDDLFERLLQEAPSDCDRGSYANASVVRRPDTLLVQPKPTPLSDDLRKKIELNRQLALEKKRARESASNVTPAASRAEEDVFS